MPDCIFCEIVRGEAPATVIASNHDAVAIRPHHPVTEGHTLVLPTVHVQDAAEDPQVTAVAMRMAAELAPQVARGDFNLITSAGTAATQTVFHLHIHIVPRSTGDGLSLPWTGQYR